MNAEQEKQKAIFVFLVTLLKSQDRQIRELRGELAAVSVAVSGLDPTFSEVLTHKREEVDQELSSLNDMQSDQYEKLLRSIESGELF